MTATATAQEWIIRFLIGGLFGMLGQAIRVVVGLKKLNDEAAHKQQDLAALFSASTLSVSLLIGFVAGVLGMVSSDIDLGAVTRQNVMMLVGVGYAGADFIEGFARKSLPAARGSGAVDLDLQPPVG